jgi:uncharacterized membrane protein
MNDQRVALRQRRDLSEIIEAALSLYTQNFWTLFRVAAVVIPLGVASAAFRATTEDDTALTAVVLALTLLQAAVNLLAVAAVIAALEDIGAGRTADFSRAYDVAFERFWALAGAILRVLAIVLLLAVTVLGLPWAVRQAVRWLFVEQAVILDGKSARDALAESANAVIGSWWRTLGISALIGIIGAVPAALVARAFSLAPVLLAGTVNATVNALLLPFAVSAMTLLYLDLKVRKETAAARVADAKEGR